jgi:transcriptional regulator with PAS, ATPase and Fis domain
VQRFSKENRKSIEGVSREAMDQLVKYDYPGNIRELENILERAAVISRGTTLTTGDLPFGGLKPHETNEETDGGTGALREALETLERRMVKKAMEESGGNQSRAAESLGLSERMLRYKLKKYRLKA